VKKSFRMRQVCLLLLLIGTTGLPIHASAQDKVLSTTLKDSQEAVDVPKQDPHAQVFAVINGRAVPTYEYEAAFTSLVRQKFYHGQIPESELAAVREEIKSKLVQRIVLLEEADRRKIVPDDAHIEESIAGYEKRYANSPQWMANREKLLPELKKQLSEQSQIAQLDKQVRSIGEPSDSEVRGFYEKNPSLFTEPEKLRLAVIMLMVDPASPVTAWQSARDEAKAIYSRLMAGAVFEEAAKLHSNVFAETGGDMGYLHRGMLPEAIQDKIDKFEIGKINEPLDTLEGVAIFKVLERLSAKKREFADVEQRARELLIRERQDKAWKSLIDQLVAKADVKFMHGITTEQQGAGQK
jgi:hypothetical protein